MSAENGQFLADQKNLTSFAPLVSKKSIQIQIDEETFLFGVLTFRWGTVCYIWTKVDRAEVQLKIENF